MMANRMVLLLVFVVLMTSSFAKSIDERTPNEIDGEESMELALIDYLMAKHIAQRLQQQMDAGDMIRKRSYWRQCAFNAVSCFGK